MIFWCLVCQTAMKMVGLDYEGFGFGSGCGWGCGGGGFVGVCGWGGGGGGASNLVLVGYEFVLNCVLGCRWRWWLCGGGYWLLAVVWWLLIVFDELQILFYCVVNIIIMYRIEW